MTQPRKSIGEPQGSITISGQLLEQSVANEKAWSELEWIACHYDEATPEQQARWDAWEATFDARSDDDDRFPRVSPDLQPQVDWSRA